jgi:hypothetical protein
MQAPVGALLSMYTFHQIYKHKAWSHFWALWVCFFRNILIDLPACLVAMFFLFVFSAAAFHAPMWASLTIRYVFYDADGQVEIEKFTDWLLVAIFCVTAIWAAQAVCFALLRERFGNRLKRRLTVICAEYRKLIPKAEVDLMRGYYLYCMKTVFFDLVPHAIAVFVVMIAGLNFLFIRSALLGMIGVLTIGVSAMFLVVYDVFVRNHSRTVESAQQTESEFWSHLQSSSKDIALGEIMALSKASALYTVKASFFHITMGGAYRMLLIFAPVLLMWAGSMQIAAKQLAQFELLFAFFYYLFTMSCMIWLNSATVEILRHLGGAFRLAHFINGTSSCTPRVTITRASRLPRYGVLRLSDKIHQVPWAVV